MTISKNMVRCAVITLVTVAMTTHFGTAGTVSAEPDATAPSAKQTAATLLRMPVEELDVMRPDGPITPDEQILLLRTLFILDETPQAEELLANSAQHWPENAVSPRSDLTAPFSLDQQWQAFQLRGNVTQIERVEPPKPPSDSPESVIVAMMPGYYRCRLAMDIAVAREGDTHPVGGVAGTVAFDVLVSELPTGWKVSDDVEYGPVECNAILLKMGDTSPDSENPPQLVTPHITWSPQDTLLGSLGMDVGLIDGKYATKKKMGAADTVPFYSMLAAVERAEPGQLIRAARAELDADRLNEFSVIPLFNDPKSQYGRLVMLSGTVRRAILVRVDDPEVQRRFGSDHYYQFFIYPADSQDNPVVFCTPDIPEGLPLGDGPDYAVPMTIAGFFYKTWAFKTLQPDPEGRLDDQWQLAPLLIGQQPVWHTGESDDQLSPTTSAIIGLVVAILLVITWTVLKRRAVRQASISESIRDKWFESSTKQGVGPTNDDEESPPHEPEA